LKNIERKYTVVLFLGLLKLLTVKCYFGIKQSSLGRRLVARLINEFADYCVKTVTYIAGLQINLGLVSGAAVGQTKRTLQYKNIKV